MATLEGFPLVSQRTTVTGDGRPSENALFDCVAACIDAMCRYWLKMPENSVFNPDHFKDEAYGEAWRNDGTDAARYVDFCKSLGIKLWSTGEVNIPEAIKAAHVFIERGIPVIFTEIDPYVDTSLPQYQGWTHAVVAYSDDSTGITVLDPFIGKPIYRSDTAWANILRSNLIWIAERINMSGVPQGWQDDGTTLVSPSSTPGGPEQHITGPFRDYVLANNWHYANVATEAGHHVDHLELSSTPDGPCAGPGWQQTFRWSMLGKPDTGPKAGEVIYEWLGVELVHVRILLGKANAEIAALQAQPAGLDPARVKDFQTALGLQAHDLTQKAQALEAAIIAPLS